MGGRGRGGEGAGGGDALRCARARSVKRRMYKSH